MKPLLACLAFFTTTNLTVGGTGYEVTAQQDGKPVTYMVNFGGGFNFEQYTAYDPVSKKFVYLQWPRNADVPKPVSQVWNHESGQTVKLYQFPDIKHPLPVIPSMEAMKFCPIIGDGKFKAKPVIAYN